MPRMTWPHDSWMRRRGPQVPSIGSLSERSARESQDFAMGSDHGVGASPGRRVRCRRLGGVERRPARTIPVLVAVVDPPRPRGHKAGFRLRFSGLGRRPCPASACRAAVRPSSPCGPERRAARRRHGMAYRQDPTSPPPSPGPSKSAAAAAKSAACDPPVTPRVERRAGSWLGGRRAGLCILACSGVRVCVNISPNPLLFLQTPHRATKRRL